MGLDATTFILEIINFLVLLWLLTRFLYRPLQAAISKRQQAEEQARQALEAQRAELKAQADAFAAQQAAQTAQRDAALKQVEADVDAERARRLAALDADMTAERARAEAQLAAQQAQQQRTLDAAATQRAEEFLRGYLQRLAGAELERAIIGLFLADIAALDAAQRQPLQATPAAAVVDIATAFAPDAATRHDIEAAITALLGRTPTCRWQIDTALAAGISVRLDGHVLEASLARALDAFHDSGAPAA